MFKTNHSNTDQNQLMKPGEYEVIIQEIYEWQTNSGTPCLKLHFVVRNDVEQEYRNKHIYDTMWLTENAMPFTERKLNTIDKILQMPEQEYADYSEWGKAVQGKPIRVKVTHSKPRNGYDAREQVSAFSETRYPNVKHESPAGTVTPGTNFTEISDEELPF